MVIIMQVNTALLLLSLHITLCLTEPPVPGSVSVTQNLSDQTLSVTWKSDSTLFDILIFRTELMENVLNETVSVPIDPVSRTHSWTWRSMVPLQCTSHSVRLRAREEGAVSPWSPLETILGSDVPDKPQTQMYPQDREVTVGSSLTFCCIVPEGKEFGSIRYTHQQLDITRLSRRSFAATLNNLPKSNSSGSNIICCSPAQSIYTGAVVFVGYPPGDEGLECETRDLQKAVCSWRRGRDTGFRRRSAFTRYTLNGRRCESSGGEMKQCQVEQWENSWTLIAENSLGAVQLDDSAHITERVHLLAPVEVLAVPQAWNSSLQWTWTVPDYSKLDMMCEVQLTSGGRSDTRNFTGMGLSSVLLDGLWPDVEYSVSVRCASLRSFWRWGDWSAPYSLHTKMDRPDAPDMWVWLDSVNSAHIMWKSLSHSESHGPLVGYEVYQKDGDEDAWTDLSLPPSTLRHSITLSNRSSDVIVAVAARSPVGLSPRSVLVVPEFESDTEQSGSELVGSNGGLELNWQPWSNASRGYVVEWVPTGCVDHCTVQWVKVPESNSTSTIQSGSLEAGVLYTLSVFAVSDDTTVLLQRHHVYGEELVPDRYVQSLSVQQSGKNVVLSWKPAAISNRRGVIRGYTIYLNNASKLELKANVTDSSSSSYTVTGLRIGSYKFTVKAYTSVGEGGGATVAIKMEPESNMLVAELLGALALMSLCLIIICILCYKKRAWVKKALYPEIPGPKLTGDWSAPPAPLDVKPPPHSLVHIVESPEWDSGKKGLFPVPEEEADDASINDNDVEADTDSDEPALLRYYNQLVTDGSRSNCATDTSGSSTSSVDSAQTQVTYTGIQSPTSAHWAPAYGYRPQVHPAEGAEEPGEGLMNQRCEETPSSGYKPQCTWQPDSPEGGNFNGCLGSPTSVTSSQFLIPETGEEDPEPSGTWFQNLLSRK